MNTHGDMVSFIWSVADLLRGPYKPNQYGDVILPLVVLRRLDCVLAPIKDKLLAKVASVQVEPDQLEPYVQRWFKLPFYTTSKFDFPKLTGEPDKLAQNLRRYLKDFSPKARGILTHFGFDKHIEKLDEHDRLFLVVKKFAELDLHPDTVPNTRMGAIFEELIRKFKELNNEEAGDHFTPREVIRLMVGLLFDPDDKVLTQKGVIRSLYDPTCGTGGMLSTAEEYLREHNPDARLELFGQDYNDESFAICGADMLIKGQDISHIAFGDSLTDDGHKGRRFDYLLANPPFGVEWKPQQTAIQKEHDEQGHDGRFGAGLPRINDGSFLFLQHMIAKMKPVKEGGSRLAIVFNGSPLFTGDAGGGESEIRRWIITNDWLEAVIALPDQMFYNTGISTYVWVLSNRKAKERRGHIQLINAADCFRKMRKSLGNKRNELADEHIAEIVRLYGDFQPGARSQILKNEEFGYRKITVERPLRLRITVDADRIVKVRAALSDDAPVPEKKRGRPAKAKSQNASPGSADFSRPGQSGLSAIVGNALTSLCISSAKPVRRVADAPAEPRTWSDRAAFLADLEQVVTATGGPALRAPTIKTILAICGERDEQAAICRNADGNPEPDADLRDTETVPLTESIAEYMQREVLLHVPDAWVNESVRDELDGEVGKVGYEVPFTRYFYVYREPRALGEIKQEITAIEQSILQALKELSA